MILLGLLLDTFKFQLAVGTVAVGIVHQWFRSIGFRKLQYNRCEISPFLMLHDTTLQTQTTTTARIVASPFMVAESWNTVLLAILKYSIFQSNGTNDDDGTTHNPAEAYSKNTRLETAPINYRPLTCKFSK